MANIPQTVTVAGKEYKFKFPSLRVTREAIKLGFKGNFAERWEKIEQDDSEFQKIVDSWPKFVVAVIEGDVSDIDSLDKLTYGEAVLIDLGFTNWAWEVRQNSVPGLNTSPNSNVKATELAN